MSLQLHKYDIEIIHLAHKIDDQKILRILFTNKVIDARDESQWTLLHHASRNGYKNIVKFLISIGADINSRTLGDKTPLHLAVQYRKIKLVKYFLQKG